MEEEILKLLDEAHKMRLSAHLKEKTAFSLAKSHYGQTKLSRLMGEHKSNLSNVLHGRRNISQAGLNRLRKALEKK